MLPPRLRNMMIGENLSVMGCEKPRPENINVHFRARSSEAQQWVVVSVGCRLAITRHPGVVQSQSGRMIGKRKYNVDEADARFIGLDNRLRHLAFTLEFFRAALNGGQLTLQSRSADAGPQEVAPHPALVLSD